MITRKLIRNIIVIALLMLLLPVLVNHRPLYINVQGHHFFPAISGNDFLKEGDFELNLQLSDIKMNKDAVVIMPIIPWSPGRSDLQNCYASPFDTQYARENGETVALPLHYHHWLGTDGKGADVLAGIVYGFRYSILMACIALLIAAIPGIFLGTIAGYYGDGNIRIKLAAGIAFILSAVYYICVYQSGIASVIIAFIVGLLLYFMLRVFLKQKISFPADRLIMGFSEVLISVPALIIVITLTAIVRPGLFTVAGILGLLLWPEVIRFTRGQIMQLKQMDYISAAKVMGFSDRRILINHLLRNGITPVLILLSFSFGNFILTEASLSFLGVGLPSDVVTWGSLLASGRENFEAWWLVMFPGVLLMMLVYFLVSLSDQYQQQYRSSKKVIT